MYALLSVLKDILDVLSFGDEKIIKLVSLLLTMKLVCPGPVRHSLTSLSLMICSPVTPANLVSCKAVVTMFHFVSTSNVCFSFPVSGRENGRQLVYTLYLHEGAYSPKSDGLLAIVTTLLYYIRVATKKDLSRNISIRDEDFVKGCSWNDTINNHSIK